MFYRLNFNPAIADAWFLGAPVNKDGVEVDPRSFTGSRFFNFTDSPGLLPQKRHGRSLAVNFGAFDMPVLDAVFLDELEKNFALNIQRIPVKIQDFDGKRFEIVSVLSLLAALDRQRSKYTCWTADSARPDRIGELRWVSQIVINHSIANGHDLFRLEGWPIALIVSERFKLFVEQAGAEGCLFDPLAH